MKPGPKPKGGHIWDDYDVENLAEKCSGCGLLRRTKKHWNVACTKVLGSWQEFFVNGKWIKDPGECKPKKIVKQ